MWWFSSAVWSSWLWRLDTQEVRLVKGHFQADWRWAVTTGCIHAGTTPGERSAGNWLLEQLCRQYVWGLKKQKNLGGWVCKCKFQKKQKKPQTKTTPDITLQLSLKPVPHYHTCIICVANTPSTPCESVNLLNDYCHSFNASDLLICCFQEKIVSPRPVFALWQAAGAQFPLCGDVLQTESNFTESTLIQPSENEGVLPSATETNKKIIYYYRFEQVN